MYKDEGMTGRRSHEMESRAAMCSAELPLEGEEEKALLCYHVAAKIDYYRQEILKKDLRTLFWKYSFRHIDSQRSMPDAVNKFRRKLKEGIDPDANTR